MRNTFWLWRYDHELFSENFTKWRLDDVISQGQGWKPYRDFSYAYTYVCQISKHLIEPFQSYLANKKVGRNKKNK